MFTKKSLYMDKLFYILIERVHTRTQRADRLASNQINKMSPT
jgi:hypothetical protein